LQRHAFVNVQAGALLHLFIVNQMSGNAGVQMIGVNVFLGLREVFLALLFAAGVRFPLRELFPVERGIGRVRQKRVRQIVGRRVRVRVVAIGAEIAALCRGFARAVGVHAGLVVDETGIAVEA